MVGVVEYKENLMGDLNWIINNCGSKDLMINMCENVMMGPAVSRQESLSQQR